MNKLPDIATNFPEWYQEVIAQAQLADHAPVRGCMVVRPYGNAIWENIKNILDARIKATGHENALFPLFIPQSFISKEADHVEGFAPELAIVTHAGGKQLEEPLVVRPTSETMIHHMFAKWIVSWRDLPLKINQWANVVRWEKRPRAFLRTTEFYWQEGHTAHATEEEALQEVLMMLEEYVNLAENYLAIPVIRGQKTKHEQFAGAKATYTFEAFLIDGKAIQMGTSHLLSQSFAHAFDMKFQSQDGSVSYPFLTSWGTTTRLVGALIGSHGDNKGLILPPRIAPIQVVIVPILKKESSQQVLEYVNQLSQDLEKQGIRVKIDADDTESAGSKFYKWELKGVPLRIEVGLRDIQAGTVIAVSRINPVKESVNSNALISWVAQKLEAIQHELFAKAQARYQAMWHKADYLENFSEQLQAHNGIYQVGWCGQLACEEQLKTIAASIRCIVSTREMTHCFGCKSEAKQDVIIGRAY